MENILSIYNEQYDEQLLKIGHYKNHPQMLPFIGRNWGNEMKKVLLIGESHVTKDGRNNSKDWYDLKKRDLTDEQIKETSPREIIREGYLNKSFGENRIFGEINSIIKRNV